MTLYDFFFFSFCLKKNLSDSFPIRSFPSDDGLAGLFAICTGACRSGRFLFVSLLSLLNGFHYRGRFSNGPVLCIVIAVYGFGGLISLHQSLAFLFRLYLSWILFQSCDDP